MTKEQIEKAKAEILERFEKETYIHGYTVEKFAVELIELGREIERGAKKGGKK